MSTIQEGPACIRLVWQIVMKNNTSGQSYQTSVQYTSSQSSAECIEEALAPFLAAAGLGRIGLGPLGRDGGPSPAAGAARGCP